MSPCFRFTLRKKAEKRRHALSQSSEHAYPGCRQRRPRLASEQGHAGSVGNGDTGGAPGFSVTHDKMHRRRDVQGKSSAPHSRLGDLQQGV